MLRPKTAGIAGAFAERFSDIWKLLSETTNFLSKTKDFAQYEDQLRQWRARLQLAPNDSDLIHTIRTELVSLRKGLRLQGYDLSLATHTLRFDGFRNDACIREGFSRLVLFFGEEGAYWLCGEDNHIALAGFLETRLDSSGIGGIRERHYLWYRRHGKELILSGSDTETKEDFLRLERIGEANPLLFLSSLKGLN